MPVESCTQSLCDLALQFGEDDEEGGMVRALLTCCASWLLEMSVSLRSSVSGSGFVLAGCCSSH